ncbi:MAG: hypothetical protein WB680_14630 [Candidatus Acidiferrales bacterium]
MGLKRYTAAGVRPLRFAPPGRIRVLTDCRARFGIALLALTTCLAGFAGARGADNDRYLWKSVSRAQCKLDDKTPLAWNVYQTDKKKEAHLVLVLLGRRYLALDLKAKLAYNVYPGDLQAKGQDFASGDLFVKSRVLPTDNWSLRDVGPAELINLTLGDYGRELYVELPHMPDMRAFY